jgi:predicted nucleic acid-binding protein
MRKVIVDTNILFSALRSKNSKLRIILEKADLHFYAPNFLMVEIFKHKERILQKSKATEDEVYEALYKMLNKITFVNEETISLGNFIEAYKLCGDIDEKDTPFVALTLELEGELWTKDDVLKRGLKKKGFDLFFVENV